MAAGTLGAIGVTVDTADDAERPAISASVDSDTQRVKATVTAGNLASDESILIFVDGLRKDFGESDAAPGTQDAAFTWRPTSLSQNYAGPDADGKVKMELEVPVPPGAYDAIGIQAWSRDPPEECIPERGADSKSAVTSDSDEPGAACVILPLPTSRPSLSAAWEGQGRKREAVTVEAGAANARSRVLAIDVTARNRGKEVKRLQYNVVGPGGEPKVATAMRIPVPGGTTKVCVEARVEAVPPDKRRPPTCPLPQELLRERTFAAAYAELSNPAPPAGHSRQPQRHDHPWSPG